VRVSAFWDTSALVPLCIHQGLTPRAVALHKKYDVVVWWATPVEIASALARLLRMNQIDPGDCAGACALAKVLADSWSVVQPSDRLRVTATETVLICVQRIVCSWQQRCSGAKTHLTAASS
jgi:hypothetical protein